MVGCLSVSWINSSSICCGFAAELRHVQQILIDKMPAPHTGYQWIAAGTGAAAAGEVVVVHRESKKTRHQTLSHDFTNYYPIFKLFHYQTLQ